MSSKAFITVLLLGWVLGSGSQVPPQPPMVSLPPACGIEEPMLLHPEGGIIRL
jgi:hypothetical protein